ncbi:MAG: type I glyceraldehyde-3-phosphate dehydrogenase [Deltaproteobacteria bacterium]|nr:MAG: type I glyceraldehyde-3-phosphate dehydrogenase [Deltaproteobacteria bacterium]
MKKIAINGLGRIGRLILRHFLTTPPAHIEVVACNDLTPAEDIAYLMKYDSVHGQFPLPINVAGDGIVYDQKKIEYYNIKDPAELPWKESGVDIVLECTGFFSKRAGASKHLEAGASHVVISAPSKDADMTCVLGVNDHKFEPASHSIISNASCTTNALAPVLKVLHENFIIDNAMATTIHAYTATQALVDRYSKKRRRGRAAALSLIPTSTGAAKAITKVLPELENKVAAIAVRAPVPDCALLDITAQLQTDVTVKDVNNSFIRAAESSMKDIMEVSQEELVSVDVIGNTHSAVIDAMSTDVLNRKVVKVMAWYDNEIAYAKRMLDLAAYIASKTD